jgi:hypothetical protein
MATFLLFFCEAVGISLLFLGSSEGLIFLLLMALCFVWIGLSSEHFYLDFEHQRITKAKAFLSWDVWEWEIAPLSHFEHLTLRPAEVPGSSLPHFEMAAIPRGSELVLTLSPPFPRESEVARETLDLLQRIQASQVFPARLPEALLPESEDSTESN